MDKVEKEAQKKLALKRLLKNLVITCIILTIIKFILDNSVFDDMNIKNRMSSTLPASVTIADAMYVKRYSIDKYLTYIDSGEYKKAYNMFTDEYKSYKSYDEYLSSIKNIDFSTFRLQEVKELSDNTFVLPVEYEKNGEIVEETYLVLVNKVNEKLMKISPDKFLYSLDEKQKFSKNSIKFVLEELVVQSDKIKLKLTINNNNLLDDITISKIGIGYNEIESKTEKVGDIIIKPKNSHTFEVEFSANYDVPKYLKIERNMENIVRTYTFELKES